MERSGKLALSARHKDVSTSSISHNFVQSLIHGYSPARAKLFHRPHREESGNPSNDRDACEEPAIANTVDDGLGHDGAYAGQDISDEIVQSNLENRQRLSRVSIQYT